MSISGIQELINDLKKIHRYEVVKHLEACNEMLKIREEAIAYREKSTQKHINKMYNQ